MLSLISTEREGQVFEPVLVSFPVTELPPLSLVGGGTCLVPVGVLHHDGHVGETGIWVWLPELFGIRESVAECSQCSDLGDTLHLLSVLPRGIDLASQPRLMGNIHPLWKLLSFRHYLPSDDSVQGRRVGASRITIKLPSWDFSEARSLSSTRQTDWWFLCPPQLHPLPEVVQSPFTPH